jgi:hypothetical protein
MNVVLLKVRQQVTMWRKAIGVRAAGEDLVHAMVVVHGNADLFEVVLALHARGRASHLLHGRHQQANKNRDDGDDHQKLDQGECCTSTSHDSLRLSGMKK